MSEYRRLSSVEEMNRMHNAAVFLGEPGCEELRCALANLRVARREERDLCIVLVEEAADRHDVQESMAGSMGMTESEAFHRGARKAQAEIVAILRSSALSVGPTVAPRWRPEVIAFASLMEQALRDHADENDNGTGAESWKECAPEWLLAQLKRHTEILETSILGRATFNRDVPRAARGPQLAELAANVANYAMFIADVVDGLKREASGG